MRSTFFRSLLVCAAIATTMFAGADSLRAVSNGVVISQIYGGGGNSGATLKNDFIELFNRGTSPVSLNGWSVQYASSTGTTWAATNLTNVTLAPGQYYLVQEAAGTGGTQNLPTPDTSGGIAMSGTNAKVALVSGTALLSGACPTSASIVDLVGYGSGSCAEGTAAPTLSNTTAAIRAVHGCTDTDSNGSDFASGAPAPRNSATTAAPCGGGDVAPTVSSITPANGAINVAVNATITVNFSESVTASSTAFGLECPTGTVKTITQTASPASSFTLTPTSALPNGTPCLVKVVANQITDTDATAPDNMAANFTSSFTTVSIADAAPSVSSIVPANGASNVAVTSPITITFSEAVIAGASAFAVACPVGTPQTVTVSANAANTIYTLTPTAPLPYSTGCTVSIAANQIEDVDTNDPPSGLASDGSFSFTTAAAPPPGAGVVRINEVDADTPGVDSAEFIELHGPANTPLSGLVVVLFDGTTSGTGNQSYAAFDLDGYSLDANGYFVLGNPAIAQAGLVFDPGQFGLVGNGADAVALYIGHDTDFPSGTAVTITNLQDAIVYGTDDPTATNLLPLITAGKIVNENATGNSQTVSSQRCPNGSGAFRDTSPFYVGTPTPGTENSCPAPRPPSGVVISQIYGGGGNGGASYQNDFVELYNRSSAAVDLTGWSLQYASSTGNVWDSNKQPLGGSIGAGEYYLIALASGTTNNLPTLPPANVSGLINLAAGSGKVALVSSFLGLVGGCPLFDASIVDFVGYGAADCGEGSSTTAAGSNSTALFRKNNGALDTDKNANDFDAPATPAPRRTAPIVELGPNVLTTDPRFNGFDTPRDGTIHVTFTEKVNVDDGWFTLTCASSGAHTSFTSAASFGGQDHYITPNDNFVPAEQCSVTIFKDKIHDVDLDDRRPVDDMLPSNYSWSFTVADGTAPPFPSSVHLAMGNPSNAGSDPANYLMEKPEFTLAYNRDLGRPNWVSWHLSGEWVGTLARVDTFRPDPAIPADWYRVQSFDFAGSGFDRGHMTPNADRDKETSTPINQATFLMSNMVAQAPGNNQFPWAQLEGYLRTQLPDVQPASPTPPLPEYELYIVAGPTGVGGTGANGGVTTTLADGRVTVPSSTWKVVLFLPKGEDDLSRVNCSTRTLAVVMPNIDSIRTQQWQNFITTVDAVETLTGYDFFSNLPEPYQRCIEAGTNGNNPPLVKGDQEIDFAQPPDSSYGEGAFTISATGGASGNPVTFIASGACTASGLNGEIITVGAPGSCTITASQAGNDIYNAAPSVTRTLTVYKATAIFSALSTPTIEAGSASTLIAGTLASGTLFPTGSVTVTLNGVTVNAPIAANGHFSATFATGSLSVAGSPYTITFGYSGDTNFNTASDASALTVVDTTAPTMSGVTASRNSITPPNHKLVDIELAFTASDASGVPACSITVLSNEPINATGDGNTNSDWVLMPSDPHRLQLRAERSGNGAGRIYTITATCTDAFGHATSQSTTVSVPK